MSRTVDTFVVVSTGWISFSGGGVWLAGISLLQLFRRILQRRPELAAGQRGLLQGQGVLAFGTFISPTVRSNGRS